MQADLVLGDGEAMSDATARLLHDAAEPAIVGAPAYPEPQQLSCNQVGNCLRTLHAIHKVG